ncbi:MAG TPA: LuxR C-terminal-related transcriptional regulator [Nitrospiraceae bacterium]|nr:LuxR C-terminal-related transcriptional regulator [Nitrospiraceae bacterium]
MRTRRKTTKRARSRVRSRAHAASTRSVPRLALTPRQKEILRCVAQGLTNRETAHRLRISVRTVEVHRFNLMRRLGVRNVAQLLRQALVHKFLPKNFLAR